MEDLRRIFPTTMLRKYLRQHLDNRYTNFLKNSDGEMDFIENGLNDDSGLFFFFLFTLLRSFCVSLALTISQKRSSLLICINQISVDKGSDKTKECGLSNSRNGKKYNVHCVRFCVHLSLMKNKEQ